MAGAADWLPGSPHYITEKQAYDRLERTFDHAYCDGVPRFGRTGSWPAEKLRVFDCTTTSRGINPDWQHEEELRDAEIANDQAEVNGLKAAGASPFSIGEAMARLSMAQHATNDAPKMMTLLCDRRVRAVKGARPNLFRLVNVRRPDCL